MIPPSAKKKKEKFAVWVESFGKVWAHICSQIQNCQAEMPLIRSGRLSSLDWGCLFFSLPVTPSPHRQTESYTLHVHIRGRYVCSSDMALIYYLRVKSIELWFTMICLHVTHVHTDTSLKSHPHHCSSGIRQIIFIQNKTWWECLRNKTEK